MSDALGELWERTRARNQRMRIHRAEAVATEEPVFILEVADHHGHTITKIQTKTLESAARYLLDHGTRRR